jgi:MFS family permease
MQNILGFSAVQAGAAFLPMTLMIMFVAPIAGKLSDRVGSRWLMTTGMVLLAVQLFYYSTLGVDEGFFDLLPGLLIGGLGMAITMAPTAAAVVGSVPVDKSGVGSAILNSMRQVGGALGIALMGAIMAAQIGDDRTPQAFVDGFSTTLLVSGLIALAGAVVAAVTVRKVRHVSPLAAAEAA